MQIESISVLVRAGDRDQTLADCTEQDIDKNDAFLHVPIIRMLGAYDKRAPPQNKNI